MDAGLVEGGQSATSRSKLSNGFELRLDLEDPENHLRKSAQICGQILLSYFLSADIRRWTQI